jgi:hypothetical protein
MTLVGAAMVVKLADLRNAEVRKICKYFTDNWLRILWRWMAEKITVWRDRRMVPHYYNCQGFKARLEPALFKAKGC